jgi:DNA-binding transcriptional LysR family regulator
MEPLDLNLLATLDALLQEGSVTGAARRVGLSTPAMSHALARVRLRLHDPILVRSGRVMVLTPRAEALKERVHSVVHEARQTLLPERPFVANELTRAFVIHASDYVLTVLGLSIERLLHDEAPNVTVRFIPNTPDDARSLQGGGSDLAIGIYGEFPQEMRSQRLLTDRFVCVVRKDHPIEKRLTLADFLRLQHIQVAPRGQPGGYIDDVLKDRGHTRHVARAVPYFLSALQLTAQTDYVLTISERVAKQMAEPLGLRILTPPIPLRPYALGLVWHPRFDGDAAHRFVRDVLIRAAREAASDQHPGARSRLDRGDPTSGQPRKRRRSAA